MKPCKECKTPIENDADICPSCGQSQERDVEVQDLPERTEPSKPVDRAEIWEDVRASLSLIAQNVLVSAVFAAIAGGIGYYFFGVTGLIIGAVGGVVLKLLLLGFV